ncbi:MULTISPECIES: 5-formyltetrahydrofolate cyclo-ligase [unclassified Arthrobacter]|uniref:5-formyltetrahydrofolate cyclo-ligase n=1 Tax=unclassified Arthrobacter TaxID=235627 RepID=UPI000A0142CD|nr:MULTISPECIES: 5-formyltetrahydrofolate cyclo-ligase [unclassified Arthrobacter]PVE19048.1 5-formyltetrahydrofolate cyclo-ligase [Arthrobacter sp. Bz4]
MGHTTTAAEKQNARQFFRSRRREMSNEERLRSAAGLAQQVRQRLQASSGPHGGLIAAYLSMDPEPGTARLLDALNRDGYDVVVPICEPDYQLSWCQWSADAELRRSPRAPLMEPVGERFSFSELLDRHGLPSLVLVPGLAVDHTGTRLGQGGGYYDRFLAQARTVVPDLPAAAYLYEHELLPKRSLAKTELDMPLSGAFTPSAFHRLSPAA